MKNTEYKCMCCGWLGNMEEFGINTKKEFIGSTDFETCPSCGSMELTVLIPETDMLV
jgi:Zn finger protein HypA/HybF involved in hydrogenase expression